MKYKIVHGPKYGDHSTWFEQFSSLYSVFEINEDGSRLRVGSFVSMKAAKNYIKKITPMGGK